MTFNSLEEVFDSIAAIRDEIYRVAEGIPREVGQQRPSPEVWSAAEVLDHMGRTEERLVARIKEQVLQAEAERVARSAGSAESFERACYFRPISMEKAAERARGKKFTSPQPVTGQSDTTIDQALDRLRRTRNELLSLRAQIETLDLSEKRFPHFVFGELNIYEWLAFIGMHERRHLDQIKARLS